MAETGLVSLAFGRREVEFQHFPVIRGEEILLTMIIEGKADSRKFQVEKRTSDTLTFSRLAEHFFFILVQRRNSLI